MKVVNNNNGTFTITKEIKLSEEHIETLKTIVEKGYGEIRRTSNLNEDICLTLEGYDLLEGGNGMEWYSTFYPTELGKQIISSLK